MSWHPSSSLSKLKKRAEILKKIRTFFFERQVLEVETPLLSTASVTDLHIESIPAHIDNTVSYLQTSPEYAMKRLLASGSGDIYQICKAFRRDQSGRIHNPEFTMLEWYRLGFDHHDLMNEMDELLQVILVVPKAERFTYAEVFQHGLAIDPHHSTLDELKSCAEKKNISVASNISDKDTWLHLLFSHCIEPNLAKNKPVFIYDFPASQAALAKVRAEHPPVASRFEVYFHGVELANGFHELQDAAEQRRRFEHDLKLRAEHNLSPIPMDEHFLNALQHGLPECSGVALGVDRLVMLATDSRTLSEILTFDFARA